MMLLMSDMLGSERARVPIFLDETGTLGPGNYKQILDMARELGFQIMTASPQPVEEAERQHLVVGHGKSERLRIYPSHFVSAIEDATGDVSD
jgi:hypothetical protein